MTSVQHLPYNPTADVVELADGSRWVRERTCHVVEFIRHFWREHGADYWSFGYRCSRCGAELWADAGSVTEHCPNCGARVVEKEENDGKR